VNQVLKINIKSLFEVPRVVDYRANVQDLADYLLILMCNASLRERMIKAARARAVEHFDYRIVAKRFIEIIQNRLNIS